MPSSARDAVVRRESAAAAVAALVKWMRARSAARPAQLLGDESDDLLYLVVSLRRAPALSRTNPVLLPLPHPLFPADPSPSFSVCLFAPDPPEAAAAALARARALSLPVADAIPLSALRSDYKPFESRRRLCASHDLFVADRRVLPLLPRLLGKSFFRSKKNPLPLDLSRPGWPLQLRRLLASTFLYLRSGTCCALKVGRLSMDPELVADNIVAAAAAAADHLPRKWANVRSLHVKAADSVALPIYQVVPELGLKIDVPETGEDAAKEEVEEEVKEKKRKRAKKGASLELGTGKERRKKKKGDANDDIAGDETGADEQKSKEKKKIKKSTKKEALNVKKRKNEPVLDELKKKKIKTKKAGDMKVKKTRSEVAA